MGIGRDQFLTLPDLPTETLDAPPWGAVTVKTLDALELVDLLEFLAPGEGASEAEKKRAMREAPGKIAVRCMVDDQGNRVLQDDEVRILLGKQGVDQALPVIVQAANRLNRIFVNPEDAGKNSEPSATGASPSD